MGPQLRLLAYGSLILVLVAGSLIGAAYLFLLQRQSSLDSSRQRLMTELAAESSKENLFVALKDRAGIMEKILAAQRPLVGAYDTALSIASPPVLANLAYDDQNRLTMLMKSGSIDEALAITGKVTALAQEQKLKSPQLMSLVLDTDGIVRFAVSFSPVL